MRGQLCALVGFSLYSCTPISPKRGDDQGQISSSKAESQSSANQDAGAALAADAGADRQALQSASQKAEEPCSEEGARACTSGNPSRQPLQCVAGAWREQPACTEGQRCETAAGVEQGSCVKIARECIGRSPDEPFCDERDVRACSGGVSNVLRSCSEQQHCIEKESSATCECMGGLIELAGGCQPAVSCDDQHGGCDMLAECSMKGGTRVCGACGVGYSGDGIVGCTPVLIELATPSAALSPSLSDSIRSYRVHLPLFQTQLSLTPLAADGVAVDVNGTSLQPGETWTSDNLSVGEHPLAITLLAENGLSSRYEVLVEHTGGQEAFIKAAHPDRYDTFGSHLALSGDTLVVSAMHEDSAAAGVDGDETSNALTDSGAAYVFVREGSTWRQQAYLKSDAPREGGHFGGGLAIDGDLLFVGEPGSDPFPLLERSENYEQRPGAVHVFMRAGATWSHVTRIASPSSNPDLFGYTIALARDQILIGAPHDNVVGRNAGAFFTVPRGGSWGPLTKYMLADSRADDVFGWSFAVDGDNLMVGSPRKSNAAQGQGAAAFFTRAGDAWEEQQILSAPEPQEGDTFGWSVALSGDGMAVGAPSIDAYDINKPHGRAFVYSRVGGRWQLQKAMTATVPRDIDYFGTWVGFTSPNTLFVGAAGDASASRGLNADPTQGLLVQSGAFYLFGREGDDWARTSFVKVADPGANAWLGQQAVISGDTIAVSCANENSAANGVNGEVVGSLYGSGAVYVFR